ncbi:putative neuroblastoma breakpoint family member 5 [Octodon degus]|uniref:Neuroblastoma breakpoint family member 5 n=1 Tax=Octodon degus TaxID=10160 RepID=A0A6P6DWV0_OCTDE|nr:putative neuroblastoma breakpoint family member 5 [Octodon degus]
MDDLDGDFQFLIEVQAQELTKLRHKLEEGRHTASMLHQNLSSLLAEDDQHRYQNQSHREILVEESKLAKCIAHRLRSDNLADEEEDDQTTMGFR